MTKFQPSVTYKSVAYKRKSVQGTDGEAFFNIDRHIGNDMMLLPLWIRPSCNSYYYTYGGIDEYHVYHVYCVYHITLLPFPFSRREL